MPPFPHRCRRDNLRRSEARRARAPRGHGRRLPAPDADPGRRPSRTSWPATICSAARRPAPARRRRSRCRCLDRLARDATRGRTPRAPACWCWRRRASWRCRSPKGFRDYGRNVRLTTAVIFGGVGQGPQVDALRRGVDILVATPGRLLDLMEQGHARFDARRGAGAGRGRPDARHGLHRADPTHHPGAAAEAADPDVLGDDAAGDREAGEVDPGQPDRGGRDAGRHHRREGHPVGAVRRSRQQARAARRGAA